MEENAPGPGNFSRQWTTRSLSPLFTSLPLLVTISCLFGNNFLYTTVVTFRSNCSHLRFVVNRVWILLSALEFFIFRLFRGFMFALRHCFVNKRTFLSLDRTAFELVSGKTSGWYFWFSSIFVRFGYPVIFTGFMIRQCSSWYYGNIHNSGNTNIKIVKYINVLTKKMIISIEFLKIRIITYFYSVRIFCN